MFSPLRFHLSCAPPPLLSRSTAADRCGPRRGQLRLRQLRHHPALSTSKSPPPSRASGITASTSSRGGSASGQCAMARRSASASTRRQKLSISRPRDFLNHAHDALRLCRPPPPRCPPPDPNVQIYPPGVYHESLNPQERRYHLPLSGLVLLRQPESVASRATSKSWAAAPSSTKARRIPGGDEGWMHKPDWHCMGAIGVARHRDRRSHLHCPRTHLVRSR